MKTDLYTKIVLTVIAFCLVVIVFKEVGFGTTAYANDKVSIPSMNTNYGLVPINEDGSINVKFDAASTIDVNLIQIDGWSVKNRSGQLRVYTESY